MFFSCLLCFQWSNSQSLFSTGQWYKIGVSNPGVFKLDKAYLSSLGLDISDPKKIALYGGDGRMLEQRNSDTRSVEPQEVPMLYVDTGMYKTDFAFFFYNEGIHTVEIAEEGKLVTETNIYTDTVFYYLTIKNSNRERLERSSLQSSGSLSNDITYYKYYEEDQENMFHSGRVWYSHKMDNDTPFYVFDIDKDTLLSNVFFNYNVIGLSVQNSIYANFSVNDNLILEQRIFKSYSGYGVKARLVQGDFEVSKESIGSDNYLELKVELNNEGDVAAYGYIDYVSCQYQTVIDVVDENEVFYSIGKPTSFKTERNTQCLWTINKNTKEQYLASSIAIEDSINYVLSSDTLELIFVDLELVHQEPEFKYEIDNSDILSLDVDPDLLIVYPQIFEKQAKEFQTYKNSIGVTTMIVDVESIYDLYASGKHDISAIRNHVKYVYDNTSNLQYLLLFGDCSYDYKDRVSDNTNLIPVYESEVSLHNVQTHSSDDYYGFMDDNEGEWLESQNGNHVLDLTVGRFPISTEEQAEQLISKIMYYENNNNPKRWENKVLFVADDYDDALHVDQANQLADLVKDNTSFFVPDKLYLDAYSHTNTDVSNVTEDLVQKINDGVMFVNFTGHGDEYGWTEERLFTRSEMVNLENKDNLSVFLIATCEFGRFDDPGIISGAEDLILDDAGAIALVTTTRPVYASSNFAINKEFYRALFEKEETGEFKSLGNVFRDAKNRSLNDVYNRNFSLLGDPSLKLAIPNNTVDLVTIDDVLSQEYVDTIQPGQSVKLEGLVKNYEGIVDLDFNGVVEIVIYDASEIEETFGYNGQSTIEFDETPVELYSGQVDVFNGVFTATVIIPNEFSNAYDLSHVLLHAVSDQNKEAYGGKRDVIIGGNSISNTNEPPVIDVQYPKQQLNGDFSNGVSLIFNLTDDYGISMSQGLIGKETILKVNGSQSIILNPFMKMINGNAQNVEIIIELNDLNFGENVFEITTWDIYGAKTVQVFELNVGNSVDIVVYPSLVQDKLNVQIMKTLVQDNFELELLVYNHLGQIMFSKLEDVSEDTFIQEYTYSVEEMNIISNGIYFYDINMRYKNSNLTRNVKGKIIKVK